MPTTTERSLPRRIAGSLVGVALALIGLVFAYVIVTLFTQAGASGPACAAEGCDTTLFTVLIAAGLALAVFGWALTTGMMIVRLVQKRVAWFWPLIGLGVVIGGYYLCSALIGLAGNA